MHNQKIGRIGEQYATDFLIATGHQIIARNFHSKYGEIDIIAMNSHHKKNDYSNIRKGLFVEVKTRISLDYGLPQEAITFHKFTRMIKTIAQFFATTPFPPFNSWRIDAIAVILGKNKELLSIEHFRDIQVFR